MPDILTIVASRLQNADKVIAAAEATGVPLALACAVVEKETGGRHVYGNDTGGVFSTPGAPDVAVTPDNYAEFLRRVLAGERSNGVGVMQITYAGPVRADGTREGGFLTQAKTEGYDLADVYDNIRFGLRLIHEYLTRVGGLPTRDAVVAVGTRYNGKMAYGESLWTVYQAWVARLAEADATVTPDATVTLDATSLDAIARLSALLEQVVAALGRLQSPGGAPALGVGTAREG